VGPREVTIVLDDPRGSLPPFTVPIPYWSEVESVVAEVRRRFDLDIVVLRILAGERPFETPVTYLAELSAGHPTDLRPWPDPIGDDPLRLPYARPAGPAADLAWAETFVEVVAPPVQVRTWNLSSIWRLTTTVGTVWLKHVPPFFAHEPAILAALAGRAPVPRLIAGEPGRVLMADVPGHDGYDETGSALDAMIDAMVDLQASRRPTVDELLALGVPDWRAEPFTLAATDVIERYAGEIDARALLDELPARFAALAACGLDDGLVHGDFAPGNVRCTDDGPVLLDWGDCGIGHPLLDMTAFLERAADDPRRLADHWIRRWTERVPGSDPRRAAELVAPIGALRQAIIYQKFLDGIEESERVYHRDDVAISLAHAMERRG
jgi:hypothetical protein